MKNENSSRSFFIFSRCWPFRSFLYIFFSFILFDSMKQSEVKEILDWLFDYTTLKESAITSSTRKWLLECLQELEYLNKKLLEIDARDIPKCYDIDFALGDVHISYRHLQHSLLAYCKRRWYAPVFREAEKFQARRHTNKKRIEYEYIPNTSALFISLGHEIGHCFSYAKSQRIMRSPMFEEYTNHHRLRANNMMEELLSWYESLAMCRYYMDRWYPILKWFTSISEVCDYIDLCLLTKNAEIKKKRDIFLPKKAFLINREKVKDILGDKTIFLKKSS